MDKEGERSVQESEKMKERLTNDQQRRDGKLREKVLQLRGIPTTNSRKIGQNNWRKYKKRR